MGHVPTGRATGLSARQLLEHALRQLRRAHGYPDAHRGPSSRIVGGSGQRCGHLNTGDFAVFAGVGLA